MSRCFVIGDLHFGHAKVQALRGITDQEIIDRWNAVVTKRDVVYVLGDVFKVDLMPELLGTKKLALGNHDLRPASVYLRFFSQVHAMFEWDNCLLTHIPVHPAQNRRWRLNVHGHLHGHTLQDPFYRCVSAEQLDFTPTLLSDITKI